MYLRTRTKIFVIRNRRESPSAVAAVKYYTNTFFKYISSIKLKSRSLLTSLWVIITLRVFRKFSQLPQDHKARLIEIFGNVSLLINFNANNSYTAYAWIVLDLETFGSRPLRTFEI